MTVTILDGGMGQELVKRSVETPTPLWATQLMIDSPNMVGEVHNDYFAAGADICTTNTYAIHHDRLLKSGKDEEFIHLHQTACRVAVESRDRFGSGLVAGSLGPLGWSYQSESSVLPSEAFRLYQEIVNIHESFVDMFIIETVSSIEQGWGALEATSKQDKPVWIAFSVDDNDGTKLRSGEDLKKINSLVEKYNPAAILLNCSTPEAISRGLPIIRSFNLPFGGYANGFSRIAKEYLTKLSTVELLDTREDLTPTKYADFVSSWVDLGATIVGGCCEVGPSHIAELTRRFKESR